MTSNYAATRHEASCHAVWSIFDRESGSGGKRGKEQDPKSRVTSRDRVTTQCVTDVAECGALTATGPHACGARGCRVCIALGFISKPQRLPGKTHPLNTPAAIARAERVWTALLDYQQEHGHPPQSLELIASPSGFARSGLLSRYMQRLEVDGRVRRVPVEKKRGRFRFSWEAVAP
jgi:hypothetical protein